MPYPSLEWDACPLPLEPPQLEACVPPSLTFQGFSLSHAEQGDQKEVLTEPSIKLIPELDEVKARLYVQVGVGVGGGFALDMVAVRTGWCGCGQRGRTRHGGCTLWVWAAGSHATWSL